MKDYKGNIIDIENALKALEAKKEDITNEIKAQKINKTLKTC